jgi:hypothetical protein
VSKGAKLQEWGVNLALMAASLFLIYVGMEAYVHFSVDDGMQYDLEMWRYSKEIKRISANSKIGHEHRPNASARLMGVDVQTSADGMRDRNFTPAPDPATTRIMMLGDSLTFGWGVDEGATYSKRLEAKLRASGHRVEIINTGVGNYNTAMEVEYFLSRGVKYKPNIVVLNYFINDAEPMPRYETNVLSRNVRSYVYFASRFDSALRYAEAAGRGDWRDYYAALYDAQVNEAGLTGVRSAVKRLAEYCKDNNIRLLLVNYPELRVLKPYPFPFVEEFVRKMAIENAIPLLEMLPSIREEKPESLWVTRPDPHPSAKAHEAFAGQLFVYFDQSLRESRPQ